MRKKIEWPERIPLSLPLEVISVCPGCLQEGKIKTIKAELFKKNDQVWIRKVCQKHGNFEDVCFRDYSLWQKWMSYQKVGRELKTQLALTENLYQRHISWPLLVNLFVTNRCNLRCWYCFANAGAAGYVYNPSLKDLKKMMLMAKEAGALAIQITGGEPTVREDIFEILKFARENFVHVQLNTNGIRIAEDLEFTKKLKGLINTVYLSFDGVTKETNPWLDYSKKAIENFRKAGIKSIVLVPTVHRGNLNQVWKIIEFAFENIDVVRGIIFQPIAMAGRISKITLEYLKEHRIDYIDIFEVIETQSNDRVTRWDFYPVPFIDPIRELIEKLRGKKYPQFTPNPMCGGATYIFFDQERKIPIPITRLIDVEKFMGEIANNILKKEGFLLKTRIALSLLWNLKKFIIKENLPQNFKHPIWKIVKALIRGDYKSLGEFHYQTLLVGSMWFQDPWNIQLVPRVERCVIQYATEKGLMSFCLYNGLGFGEKMRKEYGMSIKEWERESGKSLRDDIWEKAKENPVLLTGKTGKTL